MKRKKPQPIRLNPPKKIIARKTREIALPQEVINITKTIITYETNSFVASPKQLLGCGMFVTLVLSPLILFVVDAINTGTLDFSNAITALFLFTILAGTALTILYFYYKKPDDWIPKNYLTPTEWYQVKQNAEPPVKKSVVKWSQVTRNPEGVIDVDLTKWSNSDDKWTWSFWSFFVDGYPHKVLGNSSRMNISNKWAFNRAILAHLAADASETLSFPSEVFVQLEINPITWQRNCWPKYIEGVFYFIACLAAIVPIFIDIPQTHLYGELAIRAGLFFLVILFISIPIGVIGYQLASYLHPEFYGDNITFIHAKKAKRSKKQSEFGKAIDAFLNSAAS